jgi:HK97 family phage prohead protease
MVLQHDLSTPIGAWRDVREDAAGLYVEGQLAIKTQVGSDTWELMRIGALDGLSIGFVVTNATLDEKSQTRTILDVDLLEISPVTIPAIPTARVEDVQDSTGVA